MSIAPSKRKTIEQKLRGKGQHWHHGVKSPNRDFLTIFGPEVIVGMREALGLTVVEMAEIHDIRPDYLVYMEKGWMRISEIYFQTLLKLYEAKKRGVQVHQEG